MQNIKRHINTKTSIITIDITGEINHNTIDEFKKILLLQLDRPIYKNKISLDKATLNIYTCHSIIRKKDLDIIKRIIEICINLDFKMIDIITAKPQKVYREWIDNIISKHFSNHHIKTLSTNKTFKI